MSLVISLIPKPDESTMRHETTGQYPLTNLATGHTVKTILKKKKKVGGFPPDFKTFYKFTVIKTVCYWHKGRQIGQWRKIESLEINTCLYAQLIFNQSTKTIQWEKINLFPLNGLGALVENQLSIEACVYFQTLNFPPLANLPTLMPVAHCFDYCKFVKSFEIRRESSNFFLLFQDSFDCVTSCKIG